MSRWLRNALLTLATMPAIAISADTLVLYDGRSIKGEVTQNDAGNYVVKTKAGQVTFNSVDVAKWEKGGAIDASALKPPVSGKPAAPEVKVDPVAVMNRASRLVDQGYAALQAGDAQAALENFQDAKSLWDRQHIRIDANNPVQYGCLNGLGIAYLALSRYEKANEPLDRAYPSSLRERSLIVNRAILDIVQKTNVTRGVKELKDYLAKQTTNDEPALNVMGAGLALSGMDERFSQSAYYKSVVNLYESKNKELEQTRSGEGRWGIEWIANDLLRKKRAAQRDGFDKYQAAMDAERSAEGLVSARQADADAIATNHISAAVLSAAVDNAHQQLKACELRHHESWKSIPRPDWPKTFPPLLPQTFGGLTFGMPVPQQVALATPTPPTAPPLAPPPTPTPVQPPTKIVTAMPAAAPVNPQTTYNPPPSKAGSRTVSRSAVAVPVGPDLLITAAAPVDNATGYQLETANGDSFKGELVRRDAASGLALIRIPNQRMAFLNLAASFGGGEVTCWGYPEVSIFNPIADSFGGTSGAPKSTGWTVSLRRHPRLMGAALIDAKGALVGITMGDRDMAATQMTAVTLEQLRTFLGADLPRAACSNPNPAGVMQLTASRDVQ